MTDSEIQDLVLRVSSSLQREVNFLKDSVLAAQKQVDTQRVQIETITRILGKAVGNG